MRLVALVALCSSLFLACPDPRPDPPIDEDGGSGPAAWPEGALVVGVTDYDTYTQVPMAADTELHRGSQGGFHVPLAYQVYGHGAVGAQFQHKVRRVSDDALLSRGSRIYDVEATDAGWQALDITVFICPTPVGLDAVDTQVRFEVLVLDADGGTLATENLETTLRCPAGDSFCPTICKG